MTDIFREWIADIGLGFRIGCGLLIALMLLGMASLLLLALFGLLGRLLAS